MDFEEYFLQSTHNPEDARMYREVLDEELDWTLRYLSEHLNPGVTPPTGGLSLPLEAIIRYAQALGLSVRVEFVKEGEVVARYGVGRNEPV